MTKTHRKHGSHGVRLTGGKLQRQRMRLWRSDPHCNECRVLVNFPGEFELDHVDPLHAGGSVDDENCQVLCIKCHAAKSKREIGSVKVGCDIRGHPPGWE